MRTPARTLLAISILLHATPARAEGGEKQQQQPDERVTGGHVFVPLQLVSYPFVTTRFGVSLGGGSNRFTVVPRPGDAPVDGEFTAADNTLDLGFGVGRGLGIEVSAKAQAMLGGDRVGGFFAGSNTAYGARAGLRKRLVRRDGLYLSGRVQLGATKVEGVVPANVIDTIQVGPNREIMYDESSILVDGRALTFGADVALAIGLGPLGIQASAGAELEQIELGPGEGRCSVAAAAGATLALGARAPVTAAAAAEIIHEIGFDDPSPNTAALFGAAATRSRIELGFHLTGRRDLAIGAIYTAERSPDETRLGARIRMTYFW